MFKTRIFWAFGVLAVASVIQGILGWSTLRVADQNIQRGRVANELLVGFVDLSAEKQRLRLLLSESLIGRQVAPDELRQIQKSIIRLQFRSWQAIVSESVFVMFHCYNGVLLFMGYRF